MLNSTKFQYQIMTIAIINYFLYCSISDSVGLELIQLLRLALSVMNRLLIIRPGRYLFRDIPSQCIHPCMVDISIITKPARVVFILSWNFSFDISVVYVEHSSLILTKLSHQK